jgi:hypothetical protein
VFVNFLHCGGLHIFFKVHLGSSLFVKWGSKSRPIVKQIIFSKVALPPPLEPPQGPL